MTVFHYACACVYIWCVMEAEARAGALRGREEAFIMMIRAEIG